MDRCFFSRVLAALSLWLFLSLPALAQSPPSAPSGLRTVPSSTSVTLYWNTSAGATSYNIYRSSSSGGEGSTPLVTNASVTSDGTYDVTWTDSSTAATTTYYYQVTAVNSAGQSGKSNEASATTGGTRMLGPATVTATPGNTTVALSWSSVSGATSYNILRSYGGGSNDVIITGVIGTTYNDSGLTNGVTYTYSVAGVDVASEGYATSAEAEPEASTFTIGATPTSVSVNQGSSGMSSIKLTNLYGFTGTVALTDSGMPSGVTASFSPSSISGSTASTFTLTASPTAAAGTYTVTVTGTSGSLVETKSVTLTIVSNPILTSIVVAPATATVPYDGTQQFTATGRDQFGNVLATQPSFTWTTSGAAITTGGLFTASTGGGPFTITATAASVAGTASVTVPPGPVIAVQASATPNPVTGTTTALSVLGASANGESTLTYLWSVTGPANVSFSANGSNAAKNATATFISAGTYVFTVTATDGNGLAATSSVNVAVNQTLSALAVGPNQATVAPNGTAQFSTLAYDQFGNYISTGSPGLTWLTTGGGTISASGLFTAGTAAGGPYTVTASSGAVSGSAQVTVSTGGVFTLNASPSSVTINQGAYGTSLVALNAPPGSAQYVALTASGLPSGVWALFTPQIISGNAVSTVSFSAITTAPPGQYTATITASSGSIAATTTVSVTVVAVIIPTSIDVVPPSGTVQAGKTLPLSATVYDQNGNALVPQPGITWNGASPTGLSTGLFTAGSAGTYTVTAQADGTTGDATMTVVGTTGGQGPPPPTHNGSWRFTAYSGTGATIGSTDYTWPNGITVPNIPPSEYGSSFSLDASTGGSSGQSISVSGTMSATFSFTGSTTNDTTPPAVVCQFIPNTIAGCTYDETLDGPLTATCNDGYTDNTLPTVSTPGAPGTASFASLTTAYSVISTSYNTVTATSNIMTAALQIPTGPPYTTGTVGTSIGFSIVSPPSIMVASPDGTNFVCNGDLIPIQLTQSYPLTASYAIYIDGSTANGLTPGTHSLYVVATFGPDLTVQSNTITITIGAATPGPNGILPESASCCAGKTFTFNYYSNFQVDSPYVVLQWPLPSAGLQPASGIAWGVDGVAPGGSTDSSLGTGDISSFTTPLLSAGTHTIQAYEVFAGLPPSIIGNATLNVAADALQITVAQSSAGPAAVGEPVLFIATSTTTCGSSTTYSWTFGDGGTGTGGKPTHTYTSAGTYTVVVTANDGLTTATQSFSVIVQALFPGFTVAVSPISLNILQGGTATATVSLGSFDGFTGSVTLSSPNLPAGITASFSPSIISGAQTSTLTLTAAPVTTASPCLVTITGTNGALSSRAWVNLTVATSSVLTSIGVLPFPASVVSGNSQQFYATAYDQFGAAMYDLPFTWSVSGGGTIGSTTGVFAATTVGGPYTVTANKGAVSGTAPVTVTPIVPTFTLNASPASITIAEGATGTSYISLTIIDGFSGLVNLDATELPQGMTATFTPVSISGSTVSVLIFSVSPTTVPGTYPIQIYGLSNAGLPSTIINVTVTGALVPSGIIVTPASAIVEIGESAQFTASAVDQFGNPLTTQPTFTWTESNSNGTISAQGLYTATAASGTNTITATSGSLNSTATVTDVSTGVLTSIIVTPFSLTIANGTNAQFTATAYDQYGNQLSPQPAFTWSVSGGGTISATGQFTASTVGGPYTVTASAGTVSGSSSVTVTPGVPTYLLVANPSALTISGGSSSTSTVAVTDISGFNSPVALSIGSLPTGITAALSSGTISGGATSILTVSVGSNVAPGSYTVTVNGVGGGISTSEAIAVTVTPAVAASIIVTPSSASVAKGATLQFSAVAVDTFGNPLPNQPAFVWTVSGGGTISATGQFMASTVGGPYTVTATADALSGSSSVTVTSGVPTYLLVAKPPSLSIAEGSSSTSTIAVTDVSGFNSPVTLSIGSLPAGLTAALSTGTISGSTTSTLTVSASSNAAPGSYSVTVNGVGGGISASTSIAVTVTSVAASIVVTPSSANVADGASQQFSAMAVDPFGNPLPNQPAFTWSVSGGGTITSQGLFTAMASSGTYTITATAGSISGTATVTDTSTTINAPTIAGFTPGFGNVGTTVTITGTNLTGATSVTFGGASTAPGSIGGGGTTIVVNVPSGAATGPIGVTTPNGTGTSTANFYLPPTITSFAPTSASVGTPITVTGTNFLGATSVAISGVKAAAFTVISNTQISVTIAVGTTSGTVTITTPGGSVTSSSALNIVALAAPGRLSVVSGDQSDFLNWSLTGAPVYNIYRDVPGSPYLLIKSVNAPQSGNSLSYLDSGQGTPLTNGAVYYYYVTSVAGGQESPRSKVARGLPNVHINCGATTSYLDSTNTEWAADYDFNGGAQLTTTAAIQGTPDETLYQSQRQGNAFYYNVPVLPGTYTLTLGFAEITGSTSEQINVSGAGLGSFLQGLNFYSKVGADTQYTVSNTITVTNGTLSLAFSGSDPAVATISLTTLVPTPDHPAPGWAEGVVPNDDSSGGDAGPSSSDSVDLASGVLENSPGPDIWAFNPIGPSATYERFYRTAWALQGYSSPGLSPGWVDSYDMRLTTNTTGTPGSLTLWYPNGGSEQWVPSSGNSFSTGSAPYVATGIYAGNGNWAELVMTWKNRTKDTFLPDTLSPGTYRLVKITNLEGHSITIRRDEEDRLSSIGNDLLPYPAILLSFQYAGPNLSEVTAIDTTPNGNTGASRNVTFAFDSDNNLISSSVIDGADARWEYTYQVAAGGYLLSSALTENASQWPTLTYNGDSINYDQWGRVTSHVDAERLQKSYAYSNTSTTVTDPPENGAGNQTWTQDFSTATNVNAGFVDANGKAQTTQYTDGHNPYLPTADTNRDAETATAQYDSYGDPTQTTDARGVVTKYVYTPGTDLPFPQLHWVYKSGIDSNGKSVTTEPTQYSYFNSESVSSDGVPGVINGLVSQVLTEAPGTVNGGVNGSPSNATWYEYDSYGNLTEEQDPSANPAEIYTQYNYSLATTYSPAEPEALNEPLSILTYGYGFNSQLAKITQYYKWNNRGDCVASIDALGNETDYVYDDADELTQTIYPPAVSEGPRATAVTTYAYYGGPIVYQDLYSNYGDVAPFRHVAYSYGSEGELLGVSGSTPAETYTYDGQYRLSSVTDADGNTTKYVYDSVGNLISDSYPLANGVYDTDTYAYDPDQDLIRHTDGRNVTTSYTRNDPYNQVTGIAYSTSSASVSVIPTAPVEINYGDAFGQRSEVSDEAGSRDYTYDDLGEALTATTNFAMGPQNQKIYYYYNPDGSRSAVVMPYDMDGSQQFTVEEDYDYDGLDRLQTVVFPWDDPTFTEEDYDYFANGQTADVTDSYAVYDSTESGLPYAQTSYHYDGRGEVSSLVNSNFNQQTGKPYVYSSFTMPGTASSPAYDAAGNRLLENEVVSPVYNQSGTLFVLNGFSIDYSFAYDNLNELTSATGARAYLPTQYNYAYDGAENMLNGYSGNSTFNADNQLASITNQSYGYKGFTYDGAGNPTQFGTSTYGYDAANRLAQVPTGILTYNNVYDSDGHITETTYGSVPGESTNFYLWDGNDLQQIISSSVPTKNVLGTVTTSPGVTCQMYGYGEDGLRQIDDPTTSSSNNANNIYSDIYTVSYDPQGNAVENLSLAYDSPTQVSSFTPYGALEPGGTEINQQFLGQYLFGQYYAYYEVGNYEVGVVGPTLSPYRGLLYGGQWGYLPAFDGLYLLGSRCYDPNTSRFLTRDTIGYDGGENLYAYCGNNPITRSDPEGTDPSSWFKGVGGALSKGLNVALSAIGKYDVVDTDGDDEDTPAAHEQQAGWQVYQEEAAQAKRGPMVDGGPHNDTIDQRVGEIKEEQPDWRHTAGRGSGEAEEYIRIRAGLKSARRPDITFKRPDGSFYREQVGRVRADGQPVSREVGAMNDIEKEVGDRPKYTPYN